MSGIADDNRLLETLGDLTPTDWLKARLLEKAAGEVLDEEAFGEVAMAAAVLGLVDQGLDEELALDLIYGREDGDGKDWIVSCSLTDGEFELTLTKPADDDCDDCDDLSDEPLPWEA